MSDPAYLKPHEPNMIQELPWLPAIEAVKGSIHFDDLATFRAHMEETLPYNSASTRERYSQTITRYCFPDGSLDSLPRRAWLAYRDAQLFKM